MSNLNTVTRGTLIKATLTMDEYNPIRERIIRIWLPENYDANDPTKKFPVLYMHDGQNLFDDYTSFVGEWEIDESISAIIDNGGQGAIVVGIDHSATDRLGELSPTWPKSKAGQILPTQSGEKYANFIVNKVMPYINKNFHTLTGPENTGIGGSSMGGVISFYMSLVYPDIFSYGLLFSTALQLYQENFINDFVLKKIKEAKKLPRLYLYSGYAGGDKIIGKYVKIMNDMLIRGGYPASLIKTKLDQNADHNEQSWAKHFTAAYLWLTNQT